MQTGTQVGIQVCTFRLGDQLCGIDVANIQEVLRFQTVTEVPLAPREVTGLINLRGRIVTAIDLRMRLGLEPRGDGSHPMNVVISRDEGEVSLLVDQIGDVVEVTDEEMEEVPETVEESFKAYLKGIYKLEGEFLLLLDAEKAIATLESEPVDNTEDPSSL